METEIVVFVQERKRGRPKKENIMKEEDRKQYIRKYNKNYYHTIEKFKDKAVKCNDCGRQVNKSYLETHLKSSYHLKRVNTSL
jgi:ubiquitin